MTSQRREQVEKYPELKESRHRFGNQHVENPDNNNSYTDKIIEESSSPQSTKSHSRKFTENVNILTIQPDVESLDERTEIKVHDILLRDNKNDIGQRLDNNNLFTDFNHVTNNNNVTHSSSDNRYRPRLKLRDMFKRTPKPSLECRTSSCSLKYKTSDNTISEYQDCESTLPQHAENQSSYHLEYNAEPHSKHFEDYRQEYPAKVIKKGRKKLREKPKAAFQHDVENHHLENKSTNNNTSPNNLQNGSNNRVNNQDTILDNNKQNQQKPDWIGYEKDVNSSRQPKSKTTDAVDYYNSDAATLYIRPSQDKKYLQSSANPMYSDSRDFIGYVSPATEQIPTFFSQKYKNMGRVIQLHNKHGRQNVAAKNRYNKKTAATNWGMYKM